MTSFTIDDMPAVWILVAQPSEEQVVFHIICGLEEEGIPYRLLERSDGIAALLGRQASEGSPLNVGIGVNSSEMRVVLHHRDLAGRAPLFSLSGDDYESPEQLRRLGANAGRLVKGDPFSI